MTKLGEVFSWGFNTTGQLGLGHFESQLTPKLITELSDKKIVDIIAGWQNSFAIAENGEIYAWGHNFYGQLGLNHNNRESTPTLVPLLSGKGIVQIEAGNMHSIALDNKGNLYSWGDNSKGQLGLGDNLERLIPTKITKFN